MADCRVQPYNSDDFKDEMDGGDDEVLRKFEGAVEKKMKEDEKKKEK